VCEVPQGRTPQRVDAEHLGSASRLTPLTPSPFALTLNALSMSKQQFWTLNLVAGLCALLILGTMVFGELNSGLNERAVAMQNEFNQARQVQGTAQNLVARIAQAAAKEPALQQLLTRHQVKFTPEPAAQSTP
jgi:hypothetical protein